MRPDVPFSTSSRRSPRRTHSFLHSGARLGIHHAQGGGNSIGGVGRCPRERVRYPSSHEALDLSFGAVVARAQEGFGVRLHDLAERISDEDVTLLWFSPLI